MNSRIRSIIRFAEQRLQTDISYLIKGSFWLLVGYAVQVFTGIILTYAFANFLPKEVYGTYQFILSMAAIASIFTLTGIGTAINRAVAQGEEGALRYGMRMQFMWSIGIFLCAVLLSIYYLLHANNVLALAFAIVALFQPVVTTLGLYRVYFQGTKRFKEGSIVDILQRLFPFVTLISAFFLTHNPAALIGVFFVSQALSLGAGYMYTLFRHRLGITVVPGLISYSKHLSIMESVSELANAADKALVWVFLGAAPTAVYSLALLPIVHLQAIFGFVRQLAFPKLVNRSFSDLAETLPRKIRLYSFAAFITVGAYIIAAPFIFHILFPKYPEAVIYSQMLALALLAVPRSLITQVFLAHEKKHELYLVNISTPIIKLVALAFGVALFGLPGIVAAFLFSEFYAAILQMYLFKRASSLVEN
ncbi:MAG: polysaccharide biosynthesis protein [Parcubacteria group bacterium]|nr:polysaccharide biosynthesis protein [Parcubacteria group bacterium]